MLRNIAAQARVSVRRSNWDRNREREALAVAAGQRTSTGADQICSSFFKTLANAEHRVLLLDYDGTLAPFCTDRGCAFPYEGFPELLRNIVAAGTRLIIVSGRRALELLPLLGLVPHPEIWGSHGLERLSLNGELRLGEIDEPSLRALAEVDACLEEQGLASILEYKPGATAVHWRGFSRRLVSDIRERVDSAWGTPELQSRLRLVEFDGGLEFRVPSCNKGNAVKSILAEAGPGAKVAYLGDDHTDEDAFRALNGIGLTALVRPFFRGTNAEVWLRPPDDLEWFLRQWLVACGGDA